MSKRLRQDFGSDILLKKRCLLSSPIQKQPIFVPSSGKRKTFLEEEIQPRMVPQRDWESDFSKLEVIIQGLLRENESLKKVNLQLCFEKDALISQLENLQRSSSITSYPSVF